MNNKSILVSTVGSWSDIGADTWSTLLSKYEKESISSLYLRADINASPNCNHFFHIIESRLMKSIVAPSTQTGEEYYSSDIPKLLSNNRESSEESQRYAKYKKNKSWLLMFAREFLWLFGRWNTKEFNHFLDRVNPDILILPIESYIHLNRINKYIIKKKHPKVLSFFNDDNFSYKQEKSIGYIIHRWWQRKSVKWLVNHSDQVFAVSPKTKRECDAEFGINSIIMSKPMTDDSIPEFKESKLPIRLVYTGKLYINREKTLATVASAVKKINADGTKVILDIYSGSPLADDDLHALECDNNCHFRGKIPYSQVFEEQRRSDILLFVEDLSDKNLVARLSLSTKVTDYFASGRCMWAIGNRDLGPIEYIKEQDAGLVSMTEQEVFDVLEKVVNDPSIIQEYARKGYECGIKNHSVEKLTEVLDHFINEN